MMRAFLKELKRLSSSEFKVNEFLLQLSQMDFCRAFKISGPWQNSKRFITGPDSGDSQWGSQSDRDQLISEFDRIHDKFVVQQGRPIILSEWGASDKNNVAAREEYCGFYVRESVKRGMVPVVWDDGAKFRLLDRSHLTWYFPSLAKTIVDAAINAKMPQMVFRQLFDWQNFQ